MSHNQKNVLYLILFIVGLIITFFCVCLLSNYLYSSEKMAKKELKKININVDECEKLVDNDTHGGFLGDGEYILIYNCSKTKDSIDKSKMKKLPLTENINLMVYDETYKNIAKENGIPIIENGYYYFYDDYAERYHDNDDYNDDSKLFDRSSFNFKLIMLDEDTGYLYYYELDT